MKTVDQLRQDIASCHFELNTLREQRRNRGEIKRLIDHELGQDEAEGLRHMRIALSHRGQHGGSTPLLEVSADPHGRVNLGPILIALLGKKLVADAILAHLDAAPDGLDGKARAARIKELERQLFELECAEEAEVCRLEAQGHEVMRRPDADPRAVLGAR